MRKTFFSLTSLKSWMLVLTTLLSSSAFAQTVPGSWTCESENAIITSKYDGGGMGRCSTFVPSIFRVVLEAEPGDRHNTPWYGFKVTNKVETPIVVDLIYADGEHRFRPKISFDGKTWKFLERAAYREVDSRRIQLFLPASDKPFYISAQENINNEIYDDWMDGLISEGWVTKSLLGVSEKERPIYKIQSESDLNTGKYLFLIGRQHPAEVPGAFAMIEFVNTLYSNTELARNFRKVYGIVSVPQVNPDGVAQGHWRMNTGAMDLNHDWSEFTQAETAVVGEEIAKFTGDKTLELFIDFHATAEAIFYTQVGKQNEWPSNFTRNWMAGLNARLSRYEYTHNKLNYQGRNPGSKDGSSATRYTYNETGATTLVYETEETTDPQEARQIAHIVAEEMMRVLLSTGTN